MCDVSFGMELHYLVLLRNMQYFNTDDQGDGSPIHYSLSQ